MEHLKLVYKEITPVRCPFCSGVLDPYKSTKQLSWFDEKEEPRFDMTVWMYDCVCPNCKESFIFKEHRRINKNEKYHLVYSSVKRYEDEYLIRV